MIYLNILLIALLVVTACSISGVFLVLRQMSMMTDAITHTVLLGIVLAFMLTHNLNSPFLIVGAAMMGVLTVYLAESLKKTKKMSEDSAIGFIFPFLFSIAITIISLAFRNVHLDVRCVLLGELIFAPSNRLRMFGIDFGPMAYYTMGTILLLDLGFLLLFFKELKLATFDPSYALALGFRPTLLHYGLMTIVSITAVGAFESVGSVLVISFMIGPPATAYLLTKDVKKMLVLSILIGAFDAIIGFFLAFWLDVSISGLMAVITGLVFLSVLVFGKENGILAIILRRKQQQRDFESFALLYHITSHENTRRSHEENGITSISKHLNWSDAMVHKTVSYLKKKGYLYEENAEFKIHDSGRAFVNATLEEYSLV